MNHAFTIPNRTRDTERIVRFSQRFRLPADSGRNSDIGFYSEYWPNTTIATITRRVTLDS
jgi:hypothetical protein